MNFSNPNVIDINSAINGTEETIMENDRFLCSKCSASSWSLAMYDWADKYIKPTQHTSDGSDREIEICKDTGDQCEMLFERASSFDCESEDAGGASNKSFPHEPVNLTSVTSNHEIFFQKEYIDQSEDITIDRNYSLVRKDTRQNLVDQMRDEIRGKIKEEIYNIFTNDPKNLMKPSDYMCVKRCKTIGVSTESEPSIPPIKCLTSTPKNKHDSNTNLVAKKSSSRINQEVKEVFQRYLKTSSNKNSQTTEDKEFCEMLRQKFSKVPKDKLEQILSTICNTPDSENSSEVKSEDQNDVQEEKLNINFPLVSNSSRASYNPPRNKFDNHEAIPQQQFEPIALIPNPPAEIVDATSLNIPRTPLICPISVCQQACFVSDFTRHITVDHTNVPMERILPRHCKNFFLDPRLIHYGANRCQLLLLVKDKIRNLGYEKFKDFIPVAVMSTKISVYDLCRSKSECPNSMKNKGGFLMIWLTGLMPPLVPINFSLTVWARTGNKPTCHIVHSGQLYSIRNSQEPTAIQESGQRLLLSENQVNLLTNNGRNMLELQVDIN